MIFLIVQLLKKEKEEDLSYACKQQKQVIMDELHDDMKNRELKISKDQEEREKKEKEIIQEVQ